MKQLVPGLVVVTLGLAGCSWFNVMPVADDWELSREPSCTDSRWAPAIDLTAGGGFAVAAITIAARPEDRDSGFDSRSFMIGVALVPASLYLVAALTGFREVQGCRRAHALHERWRSARDP